jgi:hypothetical protein
MAHLEAALALAEEMNLPGEQSSVLAALADLAKALGKREQAVALRHRARELGRLLTGQIDE